MKKFITILVLVALSAGVISSCTEEVVKPKTNGGLTMDPKSQW